MRGVRFILNIQATNRSATVAGILTALGLLVFSQLIKATPESYKIILLPFVLAYVFFLWYYLILGKQYIAESKFGLRAIFRGSFWTEYGAAFIRIFFWGIGVGLVIAPYILIFEIEK